MLNRRTFLQIAAVSSGLAITGADLLSQAVANASTTVRADGSRGIKHIVILMMENRSFDHFLGWLPGADGRHDLRFTSAVDGNTGYYSNVDRFGRRKALPDLPVIGALAEQYTTLDRYFCAFAGETFPNRFYQHAAQTDRDRNSEVASTLPTIWDQLSPIANTDGIPTGGYYYYYQDSPFLALWADPAIEPGATFKYQAFFHPFSDAGHRSRTDRRTGRRAATTRRLTPPEEAGGQ